MSIKQQGISQLYATTINGSYTPTENHELLANITPDFAKHNPALVGETRKFVLLDWLHHNRYSTMSILQDLLGFNSQEKLSQFLKKAYLSGIITYRSGNQFERRTVFLTEEGWHKAAEENESSKPFSAPNKVSLKSLEHDVIVQRIVQKRIAKKTANETFSKIAFECDLGKLTWKKPDAIFDGAAIEVENQQKDRRSANAMIHKIQRMLQGDNGFGSTGITSAMIYCRAPGIEKTLKEVIRSGNATYRGQTLPLTPGKIHTQLFPNNRLIQDMVKAMRSW